MATSTAATGLRRNKNGSHHLGGVIDGAEALVAATADMSEGKLMGIRKSLEDDLEAARAYLEKIEAGLLSRATGANDYVQENPWRSVGVAAGAGILVGVLVGAIAFRH